MIKGMRNNQAKHIDFGFLSGVIEDNPKAMPSDLDMVFERKGKFLIAEWKRDGEKISMGQKILLKSLAKNDNFKVLIIEGYSYDGATEVKRIGIIKQDKLEKIAEGIDGLKKVIKRWYKYANKGALNE
tara:strand:- start:169 stop:552 length:384 start_codon:yes stop_codon:yes gene_type:complete